MAKSSKRHPNSRLRATRAYLLAVLLLTLLLFVMSAATFQERYQETHRVGNRVYSISPILSTGMEEREIWFAGLSFVMFLCVMGFGLYLYNRVSWDLKWYQLRSDFVSGVSHDFKTPLSLIRLYSETLASNEDDFSPEDRKNYIRIIARESERLSGLIDNVLDFSRIESNSRPSVLRLGDLSATITQAIQDYSDFLLWRGFELKSSIQPNLPFVRYNEGQILQAILNLLDNARKYSGASRLIRLNAWASNDEVLLEVRDYGIGISPAEHKKIFEPFYRVSGGDSKGGCGLGLYLVAQVMKEHGGRVEVESEINSGSSFRMIFPAINP